MVIGYMGTVSVEGPPNKPKNIWHIIVEPTRIILSDSYKGVHINLDIISNLGYSDAGSYHGDNGLEHKGNFRTNQFRLEVIAQDGDSEFGVRPPCPKGSIALLTTQMTVRFSVPYEVAMRFLDIGNGKA